MGAGHSLAFYSYAGIEAETDRFEALIESLIGFTAHA